MPFKYISIYLAVENYSVKKCAPIRMQIETYSMFALFWKRIQLFNYSRKYLFYSFSTSWKGKKCPRIVNQINT